MSRRGLTSLFVWSGIGIAILLGLGTWQLLRLQEKTAYLSELADRVAAPPMSLAEVLAKHETGEDVEFLKVAASGSYFPPQLFKQSTLKGGPGFEVITPFKTVDGITILVDRGTIPADMRRSAEPLTGGVTVQGVIRRHDRGRGFFDPENDVAAQTWYWWDIPAMLGTVQIAETDKIAPFVLQQLPEPGAPRYPVTEDLSAGIPNNHLQYAFTWFSLAACLAVIAGLLARRNRN